MIAYMWGSKTLPTWARHTVTVYAQLTDPSRIDEL
jgi:hypothetical protein